MMSHRIPLLDLSVGQLLVHLSLLMLVTVWVLQSMGLLISSFRDKDQLAITGWWTAFTTTSQNAFGAPVWQGKKFCRMEGISSPEVFLKLAPRPSRATTRIFANWTHIVQASR